MSSNAQSSSNPKQHRAARAGEQCPQYLFIEFSPTANVLPGSSSQCLQLRARV
jgi:hypothetical protein